MLAGRGSSFNGTLVTDILRSKSGLLDLFQSVKCTEYPGGEMMESGGLVKRCKWDEAGDVSTF